MSTARWHLQVPTDVKFNYFDAEGNMQDISVEDLTKGKKVCNRCGWCLPVPTLDLSFVPETAHGVLSSMLIAAQS